MSNLKIFQQSLEKLGISKKIDVNKLSKARSQDNLEMIQWLKRYLEMTTTKLAPYDPVARRNGEQFYSHHSQKNSFINRPGKQSLNSTMSSINLKKDGLGSQENGKSDKV
jgi:RP/EB family microtubule-associated protein